MQEAPWKEGQEGLILPNFYSPAGPYNPEVTLVSGESISQLEILLGWYRKNLPGSVKAERLGLDGRSVLITITGRRELKLLVTIFDPFEDVDFFSWARSLIDSHVRAGIHFDRVEVWVPQEEVDEIQDEMDRRIRLGENWLSKMTIRSLSDLSLRQSVEVDEGSIQRKRIKKSTRKEEITLRKEEQIVILEKPKRRTDGLKRSSSEDVEKIVNEIKKVIEDSIKSLLSKVEEKKNEVEIVTKLYELEKRVELLEAMIRLMGSQQYSPNQLSVRMEPSKIQHPRVSEHPKEEKSEKEAIGEIAEETMHQVNIPQTPKPPVSPEGADEVLEEILSNPWVEILRRKGEDVEG